MDYFCWFGTNIVNAKANHLGQYGSTYTSLY